MTKRQKAAAKMARLTKSERKVYRALGFYVYSAKDRAFIKLAGPTRSRLGRAEWPTLNSMNKSYAEKLRDPRWQRKRLEILERSEFSCDACGDSESELHIHHLLYQKGKDPWDYNDQHLLALCKDCHEAIELVRQDILAIMSGYPPTFLFDLHAALCAILEPVHNGTHPFERFSRWMKAARKIRTAKKWVSRTSNSTSATGARISESNHFLIIIGAFGLNC
jgi:hypothetical protein